MLAKVAGLLSENLRFSDKAARFGGEEFVVLLSDVHREEALALIERLRRVIEDTRFGSGGLRRRRITASFGIAEYRAGEDLEEAIRRADAMLYAAKRNGRNQALVDWMDVELPMGMLQRQLVPRSGEECKSVKEKILWKERSECVPHRCEPRGSLEVRRCVV